MKTQGKKKIRESETIAHFYKKSKDKLALQRGEKSYMNGDEARIEYMNFDCSTTIKWNNSTAATS